MKGWTILGIAILIFGVIFIIWSIAYAISTRNLPNTDIWNKINGILVSLLIGFIGLIALFVGIMLILNNYYTAVTVKSEILLKNPIIQ